MHMEGLRKSKPCLGLRKVVLAQTLNLITKSDKNKG